jgi:hypothetical protein
MIPSLIMPLRISKYHFPHKNLIIVSLQSVHLTEWKVLFISIVIYGLHSLITLILAKRENNETIQIHFNLSLNGVSLVLSKATMKLSEIVSYLEPLKSLQQGVRM